MDYTSRILSLEDSSKNDLMNILEEYSSEEKNLNKEDLQALVKNELNSVLSDSNNYKHTSYYA